MESDTTELSLDKLQILLKDEKAVALYFSSARCGVCEALKPKIQDLIVAEFSHIIFLEIRSDISPEIRGHFGVFTAPTLLVFFEGKEYLRKVRNMGMVELYDGLVRNYNMLFL